MYKNVLDAINHDYMIPIAANGLSKNKSTQLRKKLEV